MQRAKKKRKGGCAEGVLCIVLQHAAEQPQPQVSWRVSYATQLSIDLRALVL
jgi:hypothetical protein